MSLYLCLRSVMAVMILICRVFFSLLPEGELEKQQGTKAPSLKNNGAQLELRGRQGSPSGGCLARARPKPGWTGSSYLQISFP